MCFDVQKFCRDDDQGPTEHFLIQNETLRVVWARSGWQIIAMPSAGFLTSQIGGKSVLDQKISAQIIPKSPALIL